MDKNRNIAGVIIGVVLILIGVLSLVEGIFTNLDIGNMWPLFLIVVGAVFFIFMVPGGKTRGGLAVPGSILITIGLILDLMNVIGNWEAWSYCWALIVCAVGVGVWINGYWSDQPELRKRGLDTLPRRADPVHRLWRDYGIHLCRLRPIPLGKHPSLGCFTCPGRVFPADYASVADEKARQ